VRWYVSRNGETLGPVDAAQVVIWIREGMSEGQVRPETGGPWIALSDSPFSFHVPVVKPVARASGAPSTRATRWKGLRRAISRAANTIPPEVSAFLIGGAVFFALGIVLDWSLGGFLVLSVFAVVYLFVADGKYKAVSRSGTLETAPWHVRFSPAFSLTLLAATVLWAFIGLEIWWDNLSAENAQKKYAEEAERKHAAFAAEEAHREYERVKAREELVKAREEEARVAALAVQRKADVARLAALPAYRRAAALQKCLTGDQDCPDAPELIIEAAKSDAERRALTAAQARLEKARERIRRSKGSIGTQ
jgi:hypothetical protein